MATVPGIDVSYWNAGIHWPKVRATGQRFVFVKATEGSSYSDPTFDDNWLGAKSAGLLRGAYHFFRANGDPKKQAARFIDTIKSMNDDGELPPVLDLETHDGQAKDKIITRARIWLDLVEEAFAKKPIIYSGQYFLQDYFSEPGGGPPLWAKNHPLWLAQYPNQYVPGMQPTLPRGWFQWAFWQYSERGHINGINAKVDLNLFNGTLEELYRFAEADIAIEPPTPLKKHTVAAGDTFETIANKYGLTVRELVGANPQLLKSGEQLAIPAAVAIPAEGNGSSGSADSTPALPKTHMVKAGENLTVIAIRYGTTVAAIAHANNITNINNISVGQVLVIP
jgi:lysozyme